MKTTDTDIKVYRKVFRAQANDAQKFAQLAKNCEITLKRLLADDVILTLSLYGYNDTVYAYLETTDDDFSVDHLLTDYNEHLNQTPGNDGPRRWVRLMNIHHWHRPISLKQWKRTAPVEERRGMLNKIKPEMVSSYIYYHYLAQEATPGHDNKYVSIFLDENYIFMYVELPKVVEPVSYPPTLKPDGVPTGPAWHTLMEKHFDKLPETKDQKGKFWHEMEAIISV